MGLKQTAFLVVSLLAGVAQALTCKPVSESFGEFGFNCEAQESPLREEVPPFAMACQAPGLLKNRPATGLMKWSVPMDLQDPDKMFRLIQKIYVKVNERVELNQTLGSRIALCSQASHYETKDCHVEKSWIEKDLPRFLGELRYHLSLAQGPFEWSSWIGKANTKINEDLAPLGLYRLKKWNSLSPDEKSRAEAILQSYKRDLALEIMGQPEASADPKTKERWMNDRLLAIRYEHFLKYHELSSQLLFVQHLQAERPSLVEIQKAAKEFLGWVNQESKSIQRMNLKIRNHSYQRLKDLDTSLLEIFGYSAETEQVLLDEPSFCGLAASAVWTIENRQLAQAIFIGGPVLAASFFLPFTIAVGAGVATGSYFAFDSHLGFKTSESKLLSQVYGDSLGNDLMKTSQALKVRNFDLVTLPIGFGGGSFLVAKLSKQVSANGSVRSSVQRLFQKFF